MTPPRQAIPGTFFVILDLVDLGARVARLRRASGHRMAWADGELLPGPADYLFPCPQACRPNRSG